MERREHKLHRRHNIPVLFAFRVGATGPDQTAILRTVVPSARWRRETAGLYSANPADELEWLAAGLPEPDVRNDAFGRPTTAVRTAAQCRTGVIGCALWGQAWTLAPDALMDEEQALASLRGERVLAEDPGGSGSAC
jgi:hypothetical protein